MSQNHIRRKIPVNRRIKPPNPSPSTHRLHTGVVVRRSSNKQSKLVKRCNSEPTLLTAGTSIAGSGAGNEHQCINSPGDGCRLSRSRMSTDVFSSSPELLPDSPEKKLVSVQGYNKDAKVVIKVMVEGSVGPIRTLVKLGSSVDETIKLVMNKYNAERRSPRLDQDGMTSFELHHSYFSLQCLDKSNMIGDIGSRSFYMRKSVNNEGDMCSRTSLGAEIVVAEEDQTPSSCSNIFLPCFIQEELINMIKGSSKIRRFLGCFGG